MTKPCVPCLNLTDLSLYWSNLLDNLKRVQALLSGCWWWTVNDVAKPWGLGEEGEIVQLWKCSWLLPHEQAISFSSLIWLSRNKYAQQSWFSRIVKNSRQFSLLDLEAFLFHFTLFEKEWKLFFTFHFSNFKNLLSLVPEKVVVQISGVVTLVLCFLIPLWIERDESKAVLQWNWQGDKASLELQGPWELLLQCGFWRH